MGKRLLGTSGVIGCALALSAASAEAATYCVGSSGCDATHTKSTVQAALSAVAADHATGTVRLGAGNFPAANVSYTGSTPVTITGTGEPTTEIEDSVAGRSALLCGGTSRALLSLRALTVHVDSGGQGGIVAVDCPVNLHDVAVNTEFAVGAEAVALTAGASTITNSTLLASEVASTGSPSTAVAVDSGATLQISDSKLLGQIGVWANGGGSGSRPSVQAHRLTIDSSGSIADGILAEGAIATVDDSLLQLTSGATGLESVDVSGHGASLVARQLTLIGDGSTFGARSEGIYSMDFGASVTALDSIFAGSDGSPASFGDPVLCDANTGDSASLSIDHDDLAIPASDPCFGTGTHHYLPGTHNVDVNPMFIDGPGGDYTLPSTSPVRGLDSAPLVAGESTLDLYGRQRIRGGKRDLGAFEFQPPAPLAVTLGADHVGHTTATLHGSVNPRGTPTTYFFVYGPSSPRYAHHSTTVSAGAGSAALAVGATIHGLLPGHVYHYALIATSGVFGYGADHTFRTPANPTCVVPRLVGERLGHARAALRRAHCRLGRVRHRHISHGRGGRIIAQSPRHGRRFAAGHRVGVVIGRR